MDLIKITAKTHIIVTGGAGFIGSHLSSRLLSTGARVTILTRRVGAPRAVQLARQGAKVMPCDLSSPVGVPNPDAFSPAQIFVHLAADVSISNPGLRAANIEGTQRALDLAAALNVPYFVHASSIEAQGPGSDQEVPLSEEAPCRPVSDYGVSKVEAEGLVLNWRKPPNRHGLILRIGNIYGPGSAWFLHPCLMALIGVTPIRHIWPLLQHRTFQPLYIDDLIEGIMRAAARQLDGVYNITGEERVSIGAYLQKLADLTGLSEQLARIQTPPDGSEPAALPIAPDFAYALMGHPEQCHRVYDNSKLRTQIGEYARWSLVRGLAATLHWYQASGALPALLNVIRLQQGTRSCASH